MALQLIKLVSFWYIFSHKQRLIHIFTQSWAKADTYFHTILGKGWYIFSHNLGQRLIHIFTQSWAKADTYFHTSKGWYIFSHNLGQRPIHIFTQSWAKADTYFYTILGKENVELKQKLQECFSMPLTQNRNESLKQLCLVALCPIHLFSPNQNAVTRS